ncbi:dTDP-4-dehydrorhamnose 3,5-epimerase [Streptomyces sp. TG1A-60]|uniref:dTDP-4-dehydrorhamnose 3,5-epimerase n=1 Tax=Streptomyces sp. TG1A-60 TaxID=3129111 RepID=UPI0030D4018F
MRIEGAWAMQPPILSDSRGTFHEWYRAEDFRATLGHELTFAQANCSVSRRGVIRGVHFSDVPPGQAKYVKCVRGAVLDVVVDIRIGSPTYGEWEGVRLDDINHQAVYLASGLGHAFMALTDEATVVYVCSERYAPEREHAIHPLDPALGIAWPQGLEHVLSAKDSRAPTLAQARSSGLLPRYEDCIVQTIRPNGRVH